MNPAEGLGETAEPFRPRLTAEGRRHPVTSLAPGEAANEAAWGALPPLPGLNFTAPLAGVRRGPGAARGAHPARRTGAPRRWWRCARWGPDVHWP